MATIAQIIERLKQLPQDAIMIAISQDSQDTSKYWTVLPSTVRFVSNCMMDEDGHIIEMDPDLNFNENCYNHGLDPKTTKIVDCVKFNTGLINS